MFVGPPPMLPGEEQWVIVWQRKWRSRKGNDDFVLLDRQQSCHGSVTFPLCWTLHVSQRLICGDLCLYRKGLHCLTELLGDQGLLTDCFAEEQCCFLLRDL